MPLADALRYWFKLGWISFGGPAGQIAMMHAELVERRRWISERRFLHALNFCMLLPGPEAQQLATYIGWLLHRRLGGLAAGLLFVLPSLLLLSLLAWVYLRFGDVPVVAGLFYGIQPAVCAIVLHAAWRIGTRVLKNAATWAVAVAAFVAIFGFGVPFPAIVATAAAIGWLVSRRSPALFDLGGGHAAAGGGAPHAPAVIDDDTPTPPHARFSRRRLVVAVAVALLLWAGVWAALVAAGGVQGLLAQLGWFFTKAALVTFGGAYAVLPYVYQGAVEQHQWVSAPQMIAGLALGESTPGPLIMVVAFVGFVAGWQQPLAGDTAMLSAVLAATVVTYFTFLPSFLFIFAGAPLVEATRGRIGFTAPLTAITAAVVGVILNLALFFGWHVLWPQGWRADTPLAGFDAAAAAIALAAGWALFRGRAGIVPLLAACAGAGLAWTLFVGAGA